MTPTFTGTSLIPIQDSAAGKVVGRELALDPVPREDLDEVHADLSADLGEDLMSTLDVDTEHSIGESFGDGSFHLDRFLLCVYFRFFSATLVARFMLFSWSTSHNFRKLTGGC